MADPVTIGIAVGGALLSQQNEKDLSRANQKAAYESFMSSFDEIQGYIDQRQRLKDITSARKGIVTDKYGLQVEDVIQKFNDFQREYTSNLFDATVSGQQSMAKTGLSKSGTVSSGLDRIRKKMERGYKSTQSQTGRDITNLNFGKKEALAELDISQSEQDAQIVSQIYRLQGDINSMLGSAFASNKWTEQMGDTMQNAFSDFIDSLNL